MTRLVAGSGGQLGGRVGGAEVGNRAVPRAAHAGPVGRHRVGERHGVAEFEHDHAVGVGERVDSRRPVGRVQRPRLASRLLYPGGHRRDVCDCRHGRRLVERQMVVGGGRAVVGRRHGVDATVLAALERRRLHRDHADAVLGVHCRCSGGQPLRGADTRHTNV